MTDSEQRAARTAEINAKLTEMHQVEPAKLGFSGIMMEAGLKRELQQLELAERKANGKEIQ
ncbi:hypothetical protein EQG49_01600 [Periweissella cryptocerci]|uniref:Uncharacterized protein n=1 Tax=Periweissella cryptocerci TaxID=2506420 RepID=A0A4V1AIE7_9LACO|nr:hypothetical protein [Periweissella cryptocerci]QBO35245.1 hypothetical protein EQG49_01600 [Periweissella cryptocerci]